VKFYERTTTTTPLSGHSTRHPSTRCRQPGVKSDAAKRRHRRHGGSKAAHCEDTAPRRQAHAAHALSSSPADDSRTCNLRTGARLMKSVASASRYCSCPASSNASVRMQAFRSDCRATPWRTRLATPALMVRKLPLRRAGGAEEVADALSHYLRIVRSFLRASPCVSTANVPPSQRPTRSPPRRYEAPDDTRDPPYAGISARFLEGIVVCAEIVDIEQLRPISCESRCASTQSRCSNSSKYARECKPVSRSSRSQWRQSRLVRSALFSRSLASR